MLNSKPHKSDQVKLERLWGFSIKLEFEKKLTILIYLEARLYLSQFLNIMPAYAIDGWNHSFFLILLSNPMTLIVGDLTPYLYISKYRIRIHPRRLSLNPPLYLQPEIFP